MQAMAFTLFDDVRLDIVHDGRADVQLLGPNTIRVSAPSLAIKGMDSSVVKRFGNFVISLKRLASNWILEGNLSSQIDGELLGFQLWKRSSFHDICLHLQGSVTSSVYLLLDHLAGTNSSNHN
ncbi:hypothetical protein BV898_06417 [Hypsibius exemplaris]|uniref:Uncharacterized protein n=1 Tax=Hypsibius exemplaris TaxID=2072580 RepID=A0A1W0WWT2_HYPEX|nr:hypothetical protein BV898_06417 [Hypsibius exemplaris]